MKKQKNNANILKQAKGITLVALVVTIIVLLILAGVSINMLIGQNGIINRSRNAVGDYENEALKEDDILANYVDLMDEFAGSKPKTPVTDTWDLSNAGKDITKALNDAKSEGYDELVLPTNTYNIIGTNNNVNMWYAPDSNTDSIVVPSGMVLNLNGSTLTQATNASKSYSIVSFYEVEKSGIKNGKIVGDRLTHDYTSGGSHEYGFGVDIKASTNIFVDNLEISECTGDSIFLGGNSITGENPGARTCENIVIRNSEIHHSRRQGISICAAKEVLIENCNIYGIGNNATGTHISNVTDIYGTSPKTGIDIEGAALYLIENVTIRNNKFGKSTDSGISNLASDIMLHRGSINCTIENNVCNRISLGQHVAGEPEYGNKSNKIIGNTVKEGAICATGNFVDGKSWFLHDLVIKDNILENSFLWITYAFRTVIQGNDIKITDITKLPTTVNGTSTAGRGIVCFMSADIAYFDNTTEFNPATTFAQSNVRGYQLYYSGTANGISTFTIYNVNNTIIGTDGPTTEYVDASKTILKKTNVSDLDSYLASINYIK